MNYHRETVEYVYKSLYLSNLKTMLQRLSFQWLHPHEINENPNTIPWEHDPFLEQAKSRKIELALSIIKIGTYWPLVVTDGFFISEGCHRVQSTKMAVEEGVWPKNRRLFSIIYPENLSLQRQNWRNLPAHELSTYSFQPLKMYITDKMNTISYLKEELTAKSKIYDDDRVSFYEIEVDNYFKMMDAYVTLPIFLRYGLFEYQQKDPINPLNIVNDEKAFFQWYFQAK